MRQDVVLGWERLNKGGWAWTRGGGAMSFMGDFAHVFMNLLMWNIQGLGGSKCMLERKNLCQEFKSPSFKGVPVILLLQEHL